MRVGATLVVAAAFSTVGCASFGLPFQSADGLPPEKLRRLAGKTLQAAIRAYNEGRIERARSYLDLVLSRTRESGLARIKATVHFYLGAVAWDLGDKDRMRLHVRLCRHIDPAYEPDWTFISPSLRGEA